MIVTIKWKDGSHRSYYDVAKLAPSAFNPMFGMLMAKEINWHVNLAEIYEIIVEGDNDG